METMNMADNKSRESIEKGIKVTNDGGEGFVMNSEGITSDCITSIDDGARIITSGTIKVSEEKPKLTIKIDVDVSEALTGLKALQREAKEATKALRVLEDSQNSRQIYDSYRSFKHSAKYLTVEMQDGTVISVNLGEPTGEYREVYMGGHRGIKHTYLTDAI
jgi:hypothetical protein